MGTEKVVILLSSADVYESRAARSVRAAVDFFQLDANSEDLLIICDDLNLDLGFD